MSIAAQAAKVIPPNTSNAIVIGHLKGKSMPGSADIRVIDREIYRRLQTWQRFRFLMGYGIDTIQEMVKGYHLWDGRDTLSYESEHETSG